MLFTCKCLNLSVMLPHTVDSDKMPTLSSMVAIAGGSSEDVQEFFKNSSGPFDQVSAITKVHEVLVCSQVVDSWDLLRCLNCKTILVATNVQKEQYVLNSKCLRANDEVDRIRGDHLFSHIFGILMVSSELTTPTDLRTLVAGRGDKSRCKELEWHLNNAMQVENAAVEERIRLYSEQQWTKLKMDRLKAEQEFLTLCNALSTVPGEKGTEPSKMLVETPPATPDADTNTPMSIGNSPPLGGAVGISSTTSSLLKSQLTNKMKNINDTSRSSQHSRNTSFSKVAKIEGSLDSDGIFDLDEPADEPQVPSRPSSNDNSDESEDENHEDDDDDGNHRTGNRPSGMHIPQSKRSNGNSITIAKSLPISMPMTGQPFRTTEDDFDELSEDSHVDIAASIKALARSVHGDSIFGDLPQPRRPKFITDI